MPCAIKVASAAPHTPRSRPATIQRSIKIFKIDENIRSPSGIFDSPIELNIVERKLYRVIWGRCFWLFYCPRWQKKETEWISPLDFSDFTVCFCPFHFWCSIASYSRTFFHLKLLKYQICCSTCAPN